MEMCVDRKDVAEDVKRRSARPVMGWGIARNEFGLPQRGKPRALRINGVSVRSPVESPDILERVTPRKDISPAPTTIAADEATKGALQTERQKSSAIDKTSSTLRVEFERTSRLVAMLLSPSVRVCAPTDVKEPPCNLSTQEVIDVFDTHVPGVRHFLFRGQSGVYSLDFIVSAYQNGFAAFQETPLHMHLLSLLRIVVHYGRDNQPGASGYLKEVAEAFMDCQAVQARVVERVGLLIQGVAADFRGLLVALVSEYKVMAIKMLAAERIQQFGLSEDGNPVHYENRLIADLGSKVGLDVADVRRAKSDEHANGRFHPLSTSDQRSAVVRVRELFDLNALLGALVGEINSFSASSAPGSLPVMFLNWASERLTKRHIVFDEETCVRVDINRSFAMAVLEDIFLGEPCATMAETFRGEQIRDIFVAKESVNSSWGGRTNSTCIR
jgi:hypothetical protein